jgi:glycerol-3-phosphate dehydrogenase
VPWRDKTLVGVWHKVVARDPDRVTLERSEIAEFLDEINGSCPSLGLREQDVTMAGFGLVPFGAAARQGVASLSFGKESRLIDHRAAAEPLHGLLTLVSVRYTVARMDAAAALDLACRQLGIDATTSQSLRAAVPGGDIDDFTAYLEACQRERPAWLTPVAMEALARNHGRGVAQLLAPARDDRSLQGLLPGTHVSLAEIAHVVREEMAHRMSDIVFRRTDLGTAGHPGHSALASLEQFLDQKFGWAAERLRADRQMVDAHFARFFPMMRHGDEEAVARHG